jgi:hypothetical protein
MKAKRPLAVLLVAAIGLAGSSCDDGPTDPPPGEEPPPEDVISGQVVTADEGSPAGLRFFIRRNGTATDSVDIGVSGQFSLPLRSPLTGDVEAVIDAADRTNRRYHPMLATIAADAEEIRAVLVPRSWTLTVGSHAGKTVDISMDDAFTPPEHPGAVSYYMRKQTLEGRYWEFVIASWPELPVPVAFDRARSNDSVAPEDSIGFWNGIAELELAFGQDLYTPAEPSGAVNGILIYMDTARAGEGTATPIPDEQGDYTHGTGVYREAELMRDPHLAAHHGLRGLGFGHTCRWPSLLVARCPSRPGFDDGIASEHDVAYAQLLYRVRELQKQHSAPYGIPEAFNGERVFILGLPTDPPPTSSRSLAAAH